MSRGPYAKVAARNAARLERIRQLKAGHPFWGYRRIWAHLRYVDGPTIDPERVYGVLKTNDLLVRPNLELRARRKADTAKPRPTRPNRWWGIDMTEVMIDGFGRVYLAVVLDWHGKKVVGHHAGPPARAWHWLVALNRAANRQFPDGIEGRSLNLMADNGCQPTSLAFMRACAATGLRQAFTSYSNPKGDADTDWGGSFGPSRRSSSGCMSGPAPPSSSPPWIAGSPTTTPPTCTRPSAPVRPRPSRPIISATPLP